MNLKLYHILIIIFFSVQNFCPKENYQSGYTEHNTKRISFI